MPKLVSGSCFFVVVLLLSACKFTRQSEMEEVAKDWAVTIRASQVMPLYPLMEDLEPGDVFLVTNSIQAQRQDWNQRGYLPLPQHLVRLKPIDYGGFYSGGYGTKDLDSVPDRWRFPIESGTGPPSGSAKAIERWQSAPRAFFPSYYFETKSGAGFSAAFPVYGVPVGLSLMGTTQATGSVSIRDAYTYGVSLEELRLVLRTWADEPRIATMLKEVRSHTNTVFLRVINRVFLAGSVAIALSDASSLGGGVDVGTPKDVPLGWGAAESEANAYLESIDALNKKLETALPGGSLRFTHATRRGVAAVETFERPLVIGYHAFDFEVLEDGSLSEAIATLDHIETSSVPHGNLIGPSVQQIENAALIEAYMKSFNEKAHDFFQAAADHIGGEFLTNYKSKKTEALAGIERPTSEQAMSAARAAFMFAYKRPYADASFERTVSTALHRALR